MGENRGVISVVFLLMNPGFEYTVGATMPGYLENTIFSKDYRRMISDLKKMIRRDLKEQEIMNDIRTSEGKGRKGSASLPSSLSQSGYTRRSTRKKSGSADNKTQENSDAGTVAAANGQV